MRARSEPAARTALPLLDAAAAAAVLAPPRLPETAAANVALATRAAAASVPVLLEAPAAGGRLLLARALHALGGRSGPLLTLAGRRPPFDTLPAGASLYLDVGRLGAESTCALEAVLDDGVVWVLAAAEPGVRVRRPLAMRLGAVVLRVPPLRERGAELPALADAVLATLARRRGGPAPRLAPAARERLARHDWSGDLAELEAVLARGLLLAPADTIEEEHLTLEMPLPPPPVADAEAPDQATIDRHLEFLLAELAHELRNPMVTIKTYAHHLRSLLEDAELRGRFETLTDEALARMEGLLDNVLAFARLGPPQPRPVEVAPLLETVLAEVEPELSGRAVRVRQAAAASGRCAADPEHLSYALRNLLVGVGREVPPREELVLDASANGVVSVRFAAAGAAADRLRRLTEPPGAAPAVADPTLLPLAFRLARAVLERNGGTLTVVPTAGEATTLVVRLPAAPVGS
jgi:signal transduction histidine kinase